MNTDLRYRCVFALSLAALLLTGCPTESADDDSAAADDDDTADSSAPVIADLDIYVQVPEGETEEMLNFSFSFHDDDGDIQGGQVLLFAGEASPLDDSDMAGYMVLDEEPDAVDGTLLVYIAIGGDTGVPLGATYAYGIALTDREGHRSNQLEGDFTVPR
jgi:hypothetical protein